MLLHQALRQVFLMTADFTEATKAVEAKILQAMQTALQKGQDE
jgi:hypothetical protein